MHLNDFTGAIPETHWQFRLRPLQTLVADCGPDGAPAQVARTIAT
jgi:hypothetical protein